MHNKSTSELVSSALKKTNLASIIPFKYTFPTFVKSPHSFNLKAEPKILETKKETNLYFFTDDTSLKWQELQKPTIIQHFQHYLKLSKFRLTCFVILTTLTGSLMAFQSINPALLVATLVGTGLTSGSAACFNQFLEVPYDSQMPRTRNRPLVLGKLSSGNAFAFAVISGTTGLTILATMVNPLTFALGATNLVLYSFVYTPMKRINIENTWIGSVVGAVPPIMGYTAATNSIGNSKNFSRFTFSLVLFFFQICLQFV